jgi:hypothetical protein
MSPPNIATCSCGYPCKMDTVYLLLGFVAYFALLRWVLPRFGVQT